MTSAFDRHTAVSHLGGGAYAAQLDPGWSSGDNPNGGYLMAVAVEALGASLPLPDPLTITGHFLRPPAMGPATVTVEVLRAGRSHASAMARLSQSDGECVRFLATFGDLSGIEGPAPVTAEPPRLPPPEACVRAAEHLPGGARVPLNARFEARYDPATIGWTTGQASGTPVSRAWMRFADGREPDTKALVQVVDALAPAVFSLGGHAGWVPTLELTCHVRRRPAAGWLRVVTSTRFVVGGYLEEDAEVWDDDDHLVAQSRQLALLPRPRG